MLTRTVSITWPRDPPTSASQSVGITGMSHCARPHILFLLDSVALIFSALPLQVLFCLGYGNLCFTICLSSVLLFLFKGFLVILTLYFLMWTLASACSAKEHSIEHLLGISQEHLLGIFYKLCFRFLHECRQKWQVYDDERFYLRTKLTAPSIQATHRVSQ